MAIRKRGNTYTITISLGYDELGKQIRRHTTFTPPEGVTAKKAEKLAKEYEALWADKIRGYTSLDENRTFRQLFEWYYENVAPGVLKPNILDHNRHMLETYVMPTIGNVKLKNLTPQLLDTMFRELRVNGKVKNFYKLKDSHALDGHKKRMAKEKVAGSNVFAKLAKGHSSGKPICERIAKAMGKKFSDLFIENDYNRELSPSTVTDVRKNLSAVLSAAVKKELIRRNPVSKTTPIKVNYEAESFLDEAQSLQLLKALETRDLQFRTMITTLLMTGMRGGELCGLLWENVDLDNGIIHIKTNLVYHPIKGERSYVLQSPKTQNSKRYIRIPASLVELFKEHKAEQNKKKEYFGSDWFALDMVFVGEKLGFYGEKTLNTQFKKLAKEIGLPDNIHIHSLRHTAASLLINADIPANVVSEQLGHANTSITQDLYAHVFASSKVKAMQALEMTLLKKDQQEE